LPSIPDMTHRVRNPSQIVLPWIRHREPFFPLKARALVFSIYFRDNVGTESSALFLHCHVPRVNEYFL
jgi:hypothetical protein